MIVERRGQMLPFSGDIVIERDTRFCNLPQCPFLDSATLDKLITQTFLRRANYVVEQQTFEVHLYEYGV